MPAKKTKDQLVVAPFTPPKLTKIGERHGKFISDEFKPEKRTPKPKVKKVPKIPTEEERFLASFKKKPKQRKPRKNRKPKPLTQKTIERRTASSEVFKDKLRENATKSELLFKGNLDTWEIEYEFQKELITKKSFIIADFYIPSLNLMVELDGGYHSSKEQKDKDREKDIEYKNNGFKVLRIVNEKVKDFNFMELKKSDNQKSPTPHLRRIIY